MKIGMKKVILVLIILSTGFASLVTPAASASAALTTSKSNYDLGEHVFFTLKNTGTTPIIANMNLPWWIEKLSGGTWTIPYEPGVTSEGWTLNPNESKTWEWNQNSVTPIPIDAGIYRVVVSISGEKWFAIFTIGDKDSDGMPDNVDGCPSEPGLPVNNGCPSTSPTGLCVGSTILGLFVLMGFLIKKN